MYVVYPLVDFDNPWLWPEKTIDEVMASLSSEERKLIDGLFKGRVSTAYDLKYAILLQNHIRDTDVCADSSILVPSRHGGCGTISSVISSYDPFLTQNLTPT